MAGTSAMHYFSVMKYMSLDEQNVQSYAIYLVFVNCWINCICLFSNFCCQWSVFTVWIIKSNLAFWTGLPAGTRYTCFQSLFLLLKLSASISQMARCCLPDYRDTLQHFGAGTLPGKALQSIFWASCPLGVAVGLLVCCRGHLLFSSPSRAWGHRRTVFPFIRQMCKTPAYSSECLLYSSTAENVTSFLVIKPTLFCKSLSWLMQFLYKTLTPKSKR